MTVLQLLQHRLNGGVVMGKRVAYALGQAAVFDQVPQALARQVQMLRAGIKLGLCRDLLFGPWPFWPLA